ncbi:MAG: LysM peptidoglycan-binding domain-containing protein [Opitutales bacterium]|jgi:LysM repeat protein|nr:LysM peptidoglycan-binding domain-containing protein [Opitutales bacterium]
MSRKHSVTLSLVLMTSVLLLVGCDDNKDTGARTVELDDPEFRQGLTYGKQHESRRALECFLRVIDTRKGAAESHLEAGRMYIDLKEPLPAIYHFKEYIRLKPTSEQSKIVRQMIKTAEKLYLEQIPGRPLEPDAVGTTDQYAQLQKLKSENERLKREVSELSRINKVSEAPITNSTTTSTKVTSTGPKSSTTYIIKAADTLSSISRKFYGTDSRKTEIFNANKTKIKNPSKLVVGMTIEIPQ